MDFIKRIIKDEMKLKSLVGLSLYICCMVFVAIFFQKYVDKEALQGVVFNYGKLGFLAYFFIEVVYVTFTPLLNTAILIFSGYLFGGFLGFWINFFANTAGLLFIVFLVKRYGRPMLKRIVSKHYYDRFDSLVGKIGPLTLFVVYVLPFTPDDELTYIIAAGPIKFRRFVLPILLGNVAKSAYSYIGESGASGVAIAAYARIVMLLVGLLLVGAQEFLLKRRLESLKE